VKAASPSRRRAQSCQIYGFSCKLAVLGCCGNGLDVCMYANEWCDFPTQKIQKQHAAILMETCPSRSTSHGEGVLHINSEGMHSCSELRSWPIKRARATSLHISHFRSSVISFMHHNRLIAHQPMGDRLSVQLLPDTSHFYSDRARLPSFGRGVVFSGSASVWSVLVKVSGTLRWNLPTICEDIYLDSRMNLLDFRGQRSLI